MDGPAGKMDSYAVEVYDNMIMVYSDNECVMKKIGKRGDLKPDFLRYLNAQVADLRKNNPIWGEWEIKTALQSLAHQWIERYARDCFGGTVLA
jgi:hypothetical protein